MNLTDKMAYLRGMVDGMELDLTSTKEGKVLGQLLDVMQDLTAYVSDLQTQVDELTEVCDLFDQDLGDLEDIVYDEDDEDDAYYSCDDDDDFDDDDFDDDESEIAKWNPFSSFAIYKTLMTFLMISPKASVTIAR